MRFSQDKLPRHFHTLKLKEICRKRNQIDSLAMEQNERVSVQPLRHLTEIFHNFTTFVRVKHFILKRYQDHPDASPASVFVTLTIFD